jgi:type IV pilus assembly protein PilW
MRRHSPKGLSLVELLIASAIVTFAIASAAAVLISQSRTMQASDLTRQANASTRDALLQLESTLRLAGWGVNPQVAFDFHSYRCDALPCRDFVDKADELTFVTRNPYYRWSDNGENGCAELSGCFDGKAVKLRSVDVGKLVTIADFPKGAVLMRGQMVMATCQGGQSPVILTLAKKIEGDGSDMPIEPEAVEVIPYNAYKSLITCHGEAGASLFLIERYRYFVQKMDGVPWLMLDTGVDIDDDGNLPKDDDDDLIPIAKNVEDMQISYVMYSMNAGTNLPTDNDQNWIFGDTAGKQESPDYAAAPAPQYTSASNDPSRFNAHPSNIRSVRVTLHLRSDRADATTLGDVMPFGENRTGSLSGGHYRRYTAQTQVTVRNLESKNPFIF